MNSKNLDLNGPNPTPSIIIFFPKILANTKTARWDRYSFKNTSIQRIENLVFNKIAEYINSNPDKEFIFFPMNADTYGMSDLVSGLKIKSLVNKSNFKIWFNEPDIDELIVFMKSCEKIISMRFHGCIFGITASIPTTGIDYGIGRVSKVKHLYNDLGIEDDCLLCLSESEISQWKII